MMQFKPYNVHMNKSPNYKDPRKEQGVYKIKGISNTTDEKIILKQLWTQGVHPSQLKIN